MVIISTKQILPLLNRNVGGMIKFSLGKYYMKHTIFYKNTYEFWALGSTIEYAPAKVASLDLRIRYEPQEFSLNFTHAPTSTQILSHATPSLPSLSGSINITHGKLNIKTFGKIDILKYEVEGDVNIQPNNHHLVANGKWIPKDKHIFVSSSLSFISPFVSVMHLVCKAFSNFITTFYFLIILSLLVLSYTLKTSPI